MIIVLIRIRTHEMNSLCIIDPSVHHYPQREVCAAFMASMRFLRAANLAVVLGTNVWRDTVEASVQTKRLLQHSHDLTWPPKFCVRVVVDYAMRW